MVSELSDERRCLSNDIIEIYGLLGIEATRAVLIDEITGVVKHEGEYINSRHIEVLCDVMTSRGILISINRQGINHGDVGPLARSSFENTTDQLIKAAIFSEKDTLKGVSSNIMLGQTIRSGTGLSNILLDESELLHLLSEKQIEEDEFHVINEHNIGDYMKGEDLAEDGCDLDDFKFSFE